MSLVAEWVQSFKGFHWNVKRFMIFSFLWNTGMGVFGVLYNLYIRSLGFEQVTVGHAVAAATIATALVLVPTGLLYDRAGPKPVVLAGLIGAAAALTFRCLAVSEPTLVTSAFLSGLPVAFVQVAALPLLAEYSEPEQRTHLFSFHQALVPRISRALGDVKAVAALQLASIPFMLITAFSTHFLFASIGYLFRQALMNAANPMYMSLMMGRVEKSLRGLANSIRDAVFHLGWFIAAPISSSIVTAKGAYWGYVYVFCLTTIVYVMTSVFFYSVFRRDDRHAQAEQ